MPFVPPFTWQQPVDNHALEGNTFGLNESKTQLYLDVAQGDELAAIEFILGYPSGVSSTTGLIQRVRPCSHPKYPWMYATRESMRCYQFTGKTQGPDGSNYAQYGYSRIVVDFQTLPYDVLPDGQITYEWQRYVERTSVTSVENIVVPRGTFKFVDGPANQAPFNQGRIFRLPKTDIVWTWHQVPDSFLMRDKFATIGLNIQQCLGCVNEFWFPSVIPDMDDPNNPQGATGYPPGTLLLLSAVPKPFVAPVSPNDVGINTTGSPARVWSVEFRFLFIDPPTAANYGYRGHNLFPVKQVAKDGSINVSDNFYLATSTGTTGGTFLYPNADFNDLFEQAE